MAVFTFEGFVEGSTVAIAAEQGDNSASGSVAAWGQGTLASLDIALYRPTALIAPAMIWFEAINPVGFGPGGPASGEQYDPRLHEITYIWTIRGAPNPPYSAPENMIPEWNDANTAYGPKVMLPFFEPGAYTIDLWATDQQGNVGTAETTIVVGDADAVYTGSRTILFDTTGTGDSGTYPGCQVVTSVAAAQTAIDAVSGDPARLLIKRDQTIVGGLNLKDADIDYIGAWGSGAKPVVTGKIEVQNSRTNPQLTLTDLDFQGTWNAVTESGTLYQPLGFNFSNTECWYQIVNCGFDGFENVVPNPKTAVVGQVSFANCSITNWQNFGMFYNDMPLAGCRIALVGTAIAQHVDAKNGGDSSQGSSNNNNGPLRISRVPDTYIGCCDFFSRNGWSGNADQPAIKINTDAELGNFVNMDRVVGEGGNQVLTLEGFAGLQANPGNYILDKLLLMGTAKTTRRFIVSSFGGTTIRNFYGWRPNVVLDRPDLSWLGAVSFEVHTGHANSNAANDVALYSSTSLSQVTSANDPADAWLMDDDAIEFTDITIENNVRHAPTLDTPVTVDAPLNIATALPGITPRYKGIWYKGDASIDTTYASPSSVPLPRPQNGSQAYRSATTGRVAYDDFFGHIRGANPSRGAVEP